MPGLQERPQHPGLPDGAVLSTHFKKRKIKLIYHFITVGSDLADHQSGVMLLIIGSAKCQQARDNLLSGSPAVDSFKNTWRHKRSDCMVSDQNARSAASIL